MGMVTVSMVVGVGGDAVMEGNLYYFGGLFGSFVRLGWV